MKTTGTNGRPLIRLECIKQAITRFIHDKLAINSGHRFAFATLSKSAAWLKKEFTSDAESAVASLRGLSATKSSGPADLTLLFQEAAQEAKTSRAQNRILRVILIYCRSSVRPTHDWLVNQKLFTLDVMYLHDKPGPDNSPQDVYGSFDDIIQHVSEYQGYIFASGQGYAQTVFKRMSMLLSYPPQRCAQVDLPKPPAKKVVNAYNMTSFSLCFYIYSFILFQPAVSCDKSASNSKREVNRPLEKTPNTNTKRIHSLGKHQASAIKNYDENLVGSRIKILWPMDQRYYEAVVKSYDSAKKRHLVCYHDGDKEILYMRNEKWYFVNESKSSKDEEANQTGCDEETSRMPQNKKAKTSKEQSTNKQSMMDIPPEMFPPFPRYVKKDDEVPQVSRRQAEQVLSSCASQLKKYLTETVKSSSLSLDKHSGTVDSICEVAFNALKQEEAIANENEEKQKATEVSSSPELTCVPKKRLNLEHSFSVSPHDLSVEAAISSINEKHESVPPRRETAAEGGVKTQERKTQQPVAEEKNVAESESQTHKRAQVEKLQA